MRAALSVLMLFAIAAAAALLAGNNQGVITIFWPPHRIDLSLNLVLLLLAALFVVLHLALRAMAALVAMPTQARRWRMQQRERTVLVALLDSLQHLSAGRFIRARKAAELALAQEDLIEKGAHTLPHAGRLRAMAHLLAAEGAHSLLDKDARSSHFQQALQATAERDATEAREGLQLRAAGWAMDDRDAISALRWLDDLPQGASRRTAALRLRLKAARLAGQTAAALETARLLAKHRAFTEVAAQSILRGLILELLIGAKEPGQLQRVWEGLDAKERARPEVATAAACRMLELGGDASVSRQWLLPIWDQMMSKPASIDINQRLDLVDAVALGFTQTQSPPDAHWLGRIEAAQLRDPGDALLQYLAGVTCLRLQLWGKAQQLLSQSLPKLKGGRLERSARMALADLAEQRGDSTATTEAWRQAAKASMQPGPR
jgi:HemY protein